MVGSRKVSIMNHFVPPYVPATHAFLTKVEIRRKYENLHPECLPTTVPNEKNKHLENSMLPEMTPTRAFGNAISW
jgi:hypothetical protein